MELLNILQALSAALHFSTLFVIIVSEHWSSLACSFKSMTTAVSSCTSCWCVFNENSLVVYYVCSLSLRFSRSMTTTSLHESGTRFLGVRAKWNIVCLGPPPSLPLGLWSRWTVIKQGCAESALCVFCALAFTLFLFVLIPRGFVFLHRRLKPYVHVQTLYAKKCCFGGVYIFF